jgi:hypothetical protein
MKITKASPVDNEGLALEKYAEPTSGDLSRCGVREIATLAG